MLICHKTKRKNCVIKKWQSLWKSYLCEFKIQSGYYVYFRTKTLEKGIEPHYLASRLGL